MANKTMRERQRGMGPLRDPKQPIWKCGRLGCDELVAMGCSFCKAHEPKEK
jgi:hypothetical protein